MRDLRVRPPDKEATTPRPGHDAFADDPASGVPTDPDLHGQRARRRRRALGAGLVALGLAAGFAAVLVWTGEAMPLARSVWWLFDPPPPVAVGVTPAADTVDVRLDAPVRVTAEHGHLTKVEVVAGDGEKLKGKLLHEGRRWQSDAPLQPGTNYTVRWSAVNLQDKPKRNTTGFSTLTPDGELEIVSRLPLDGETVGVGQPIILGFSQPVENKEAVERALTVTNSKNPVGAWSWFGDDQIRYRPAQYWPAYSTVDVTADLAGLDAGGGVWGVENWSLDFEVGAKQISTVDVTTHTMTVEVDGEMVREMPMSAGRPGWDTQNGVHLVMEKVGSMVMDSASFGMAGLYTQAVDYAVRLTNSGEFVHAAPWSVGDQGSSNVSHGCINLSTDNAGWYFEMAQRGDLVEVVGSDKPPEQTDGMIAWNQSFTDWNQGSALPDMPRAIQPV